jgi:hypothetical protein
MRWGGGLRPDGFCSLIHSPTNSLGNLEKFSWSYDSKYSKRSRGYEFNVEEDRKMFDYITALAMQKELRVDGNNLNAHVIITNALEPAKMKTAAHFLRCEHRLGKKRTDLKLVFMMEEFLVTLFDRVRQDEGTEDKVAKRWGYLSERLDFHMRQQNADGYVLLGKDEANALVDWVVHKPAVETPVDIAQLRDSLDETMSGK